MKSTAYTFTGVGIIGLVLLVLFFCGVLPIHITGAARILTGLVMGIMFVIFLWIGIRSFGQIKQLKDATATEDALQDEILKWFLVPTVPMSLISPSTTISRRRRCIFPATK